MTQIRIFRASDEPQVIQLWQACGLVVPWNVPHLDIARKLDFQPDLFFVAEQDDEIVGTAMAGYEGHRGWVNYLAVAPRFQRHGLGRQLMGFVEERLAALGYDGWVGCEYQPTAETVTGLKWGKAYGLQA